MGRWGKSLGTATGLGALGLGTGYLERTTTESEHNPVADVLLGTAGAAAAYPFLRGGSNALMHQMGKAKHEALLKDIKNNTDLARGLTPPDQDLVWKLLGDEVNLLEKREKRNSRLTKGILASLGIGATLGLDYTDPLKGE